MTNLSIILPIILYILGILLLLVLIILGVRLIQILDKAERVIDNVEEKVNTLNGLFYVIDKTTSSIDLISTKVVNSVVNLISKVFGKDKFKEDDINE